MKPEAALAKTIRVALEKDSRCRVVPNFVGLVFPYHPIAEARKTGDWSEVAKKHPVHAGLGKGSADLVGILRGGRAIALEVKMPGRGLRAVEQPEQGVWLAAVRRWGGFACVVRSPEEAVSAVTRALGGASE